MTMQGKGGDDVGWGSREGDETMARHLASIPKWGTREKRKSISIWHFSVLNNAAAAIPNVSDSSKECFNIITGLTWRASSSA